MDNYEHITQHMKPLESVRAPDGTMLFKMTANFLEMCELAHANARAHGFHPEGQTEDEFIVRQANNLHGEVSEWHEAWRNGMAWEPCDKTPKMVEQGLPIITCTEEELADVVIRCMDISKRLNINLHRAVMVKMAYNTSRPFMHGNKKS